MEIVNTYKKKLESKSTKNEFKEKIKNMKYNSLIDLQTEIKKSLLASNALRTQKQNPYCVKDSDGKITAHFNPKMLRYMNALICQKLTNINNRLNNG